MHDIIYTTSSEYLSEYSSTRQGFYILKSTVSLVFAILPRLFNV